MWIKYLFLWRGIWKHLKTSFYPGYTTSTLIRGAFSIFCHFGIKARGTTLIFVEFITFHERNLPDVVHKVLTVFTGHTLHFGIFLSIPLIYWNTAVLVFYWHWNYLPESASCILEIIRTHRVQASVVNGMWQLQNFVSSQIVRLRSGLHHWWGFSTRNAHMIHIVNQIRLKMLYTS